MVKRGRFAPTPSGLLHIGNAFTALAAWLPIRGAGGEFVLRIEDIDKARSRPAYAEQQQDDLHWLGIDWDEGPHEGGPYAPYTQSLREERYEAALDHLHKTRRIYPCYCSRRELAFIGSAPHGLLSEGAAYFGICRHLTAEEQANRETIKTPAIRFIMPSAPIQFHDGIVGPVSYDGDALGDFVVKRADGMFSYQLAVTVDDADMRITDVLRGADLLDSTPRQLALYEALGLQAPSFAHVPIISNEKGERFSKRDQSLTLASLRNSGVQPERLIGAIAHMSGWIERLEPITAKELLPIYKPVHRANGQLVFTRRLLQWLTEH